MSLKMKMQLLQVFNRWRKVAVKAEYSGGRRCLFSGHGIALQLICGGRFMQEKSIAGSIRADVLEP
jgi:hypothetical protein